MAEPSRPVVYVMHLKMPVKLQELSSLKFRLCLLKYSSLASFTRLESWLNASWWLCDNALCRSSAPCHFELGGPSRVALDMVPLGDEMSIGSGEGCCCFSLGECSGTREGHLFGGGSSLSKAKGMGCQCMPQQYMVGSYQCAMELHRANS